LLLYILRLRIFCGDLIVAGKNWNILWVLWENVPNFKKI
jgi:hypothetical protein